MSMYQENLRQNITYIDQSHLNYTNWAKDVPNNNNCQEDCTTMQLKSGQWNNSS